MNAAITQSVSDQVLAIVAAHFDRRADELTQSTRFCGRRRPGDRDADLDGDPLDRIEIVMAIEEHFGVTVDDFVIETLETVDDIVRALQPDQREAAVA